MTKPVNFMVGMKGKSWDLATLEAAGVRRVSLATSLWRAAMAGVRAAAEEVRDSGTFGYVDRSLTEAACIAAGCWIVASVCGAVLGIDAASGASSAPAVGGRIACLHVCDGPPRWRAKSARRSAGLLAKLGLCPGRKPRARDL